MFARRLFVNLTARMPSSKVVKRGMASGGGKSGSYSLPKGEAYPNEAYPFGLGPGSKTEGWEAITYICYLGCTLWLVGGLAFKENDSFKVSQRHMSFSLPL
jgi:hypothetical protein